MVLRLTLAAGLLAVLGVAATVADTLELTDGAVLKDCYVRDEGVRYTVWKSLADVGGGPTIYPRSAVKNVKIERAPDWDQHPDRPDLSVTFIEITPKLAGLHGRVQYDELGRPWIGGDSKLLVDLGDRKYTAPQDAVKNLKLRYTPGEELTFTAHVKNLGFAPAKAFRYAWYVTPEDKGPRPGDFEADLGEPLQKGEYGKPLAEMEEATFELKWPWQDGRHLVSFRVLTEQPEIQTINNTATDALWAWPFTYVVSHGRVQAWHANRNAQGGFSFEDFYRWHIDIMNLLFAASVFPASPEGIRARVRLDRVIYADEVRDNEPVIAGKRQSLFAADGIRYDQGGWSWNDSDEERKTGNWAQVDHKWRNQTEWSLPHELGHQLGLVDHYNIDYAGHEDHRWADNGAKVTHFQRNPEQMMHWHGPQVYGETDAGYLNHTLDKPRGYFGDYYFAIPRSCGIQVVDINGRPLAGAQVEVFQRGVEVDDKTGRDTEYLGKKLTVFDAIEDGKFNKPVSKAPVIAGMTNEVGLMPLPPRTVAPVKTLNGFERADNPFGNINVVGERGLLLVKITKGERTGYYWIEAYDLVTLWFRGQRESGGVVAVLKLPVGSVDSPPPPAGLKAERDGQEHVRVSWAPPADRLERQYLHNVLGYRVYRRISDDGLNDRPWFPVATLSPEARECRVDLREFPKDTYWFKPEGQADPTNRFGVTALGPCSVESELVEIVLK